MSRAFGAVVPPGRIVGLDVARCIALVGMIATHSLESTTPDGGVTVVQQIAAGRASALFAVLAGVSLALMSGGTTPVRGAEARAVSAGLAVRAGAIAVLGLALGGVSSGVLVILAYYGVLFLLGIPFLRLTARPLALLGAVWVLVVPVVMHVVRRHLAEAPVESPTFASLADPLQLAVQLTVTGSYPAVPWLGYLLVGMALGRLDLTRWRTAWTLVVVGVGVALASWWGSKVLVARPGVREELEQTLTGPYASLEFALQHGLFGTTPTGTGWWLAVDAPHSGTPFDLAATIGSSLAVIGCCLVVGRLLPTLAAVVFGAGAMTLTLYSGHLMLRSPAFLPDHDTRTFLIHVAIVMAVGAAYRLGRTPGPLEQLVSRMAGGTANKVRS